MSLLLRLLELCRRQEERLQEEDFVVDLSYLCTIDGVAAEIDTMEGHELAPELLAVLNKQTLDGLRL
jgi:hypothetical protein